MKKIFSYGGGVQSVALGRLILEGRFEEPDLVIFADTQAEPVGVYESVQREFALFKAAGIEAMTITAGDLSVLPKGKKYPNYSLTPHFTLDPYNGNKGMLRRQCTSRFKIEPMQKLFRQRKWHKEGVELWLGISTDEITRVNVSRFEWITNRYPLIEMDVSRAELEAFLSEREIVPTKSACVFCPYRSAENWRLVREVPEDWAKAIAYDESIREIRPDHFSFVHASRKPLVDAVDDPIPGLADDECAGICMT